MRDSSHFDVGLVTGESFSAILNFWKLSTFHLFLIGSLWRVLFKFSTFYYWRLGLLIHLCLLLNLMIMWEKHNPKLRIALCPIWATSCLLTVAVFSAMDNSQKIIRENCGCSVSPVVTGHTLNVPMQIKMNTFVISANKTFWSDTFVQMCLNLNNVFIVM